MSRLQRILLVFLAVAASGVWYAVFTSSREGLWIYFLDVGQGDSIFIQAENGNQILIDGGPGNTVLSELGRVMPFYDRSIDLVILTHPDADHLNGLVEVLKRYRVGMVLETGVHHPAGAYAEWRNMVDDGKPQRMLAQAGTRFWVADDIAFEIISPLRLMAGAEPKKTNDTSIVLRMDYGEFSTLFTGDIESDIERKLAILASEKLDVDILKTPHHGSKTSSSNDFLARVTPQAAIIMLGKNNRYGHPHAEVVRRFQERGIPIHRTDIEGAIVLQAFVDGSYTIVSDKVQ